MEMNEGGYPACFREGKESPGLVQTANPTNSELTDKAPAPSIGAQLFYFILFSKSSEFIPILFVP
jgi:hypothetical protein